MRFAAVAVAAILSLSAAGATEPGGARPAYNAKPLTVPPNDAAITRRFWAPGLDDGFTPQGVAVSGETLFVSTYGEGGCRVYRMAAKDSAVAGFVAVPACRHGGGIAVLPDGRIILIDTRALFVLRDGAVTTTIALDKPLTGSFGTIDGDDFWIGSYDATNPGRLWRLPLSLLGRARIGEIDATKALRISTRAQGLAFARGEPWLAFSGSSFGRISRIDLASGDEIESFSMPDGIEDIDADADGTIWAVSEAGAKKYQHWRANFPLVFAIDAKRLK